MALTSYLAGRYKALLDLTQQIEHEMDEANDDRLTSYLVIYLQEARSALQMGWERVTTNDVTEGNPLFHG